MTLREFWETHCVGCAYCAGSLEVGDALADVCEQEDMKDCPHIAGADHLLDEVVPSTSIPGAFDLTVNAEALTHYMEEIFAETGARIAERVVREKLDQLIEDTCRSQIQAMTKAAMEARVNAAVEAYFSAEVMVTTDRWGDPEKTTRAELLRDNVEKALQKFLDRSNLDYVIDSVAEKRIDSFMTAARRDIKAKIEAVFTKATLATFTESVVSVLTSTETYRGMQESINALLPEPGKK